MKIPHDKFCVLPWISLEASPIGTVRPCCLARNETVDDAGEKYRLGATSLSEIQDSTHMKELRQNFLDGVRTSDCSRCWAEEDAGRTSKRMHTLDRLKHIVTDDHWTTAAKSLVFLDLKLGNICNLKCRICGSWSSSTYAVEDITNDIGNPDRKNTFAYTMLKEGRWPRENTDFWQDLEQHIGDIRYLEFTGGEPFMIQEHFDLLESLVKSGLAKNVEIHYNTNGTIYPQQAEDIWRHFKHVEIAFSIDDVSARFEYQRSGADWKEVNDHIRLFREMRSRNPNMRLQVCTTVSVFNVMYLDEVATWIDQQKFNFVYWNILHDPPEFCIATLPESVKSIVEHRLLSGSFSPSNRREINNIVGFMQQGVSTNGQRLIASIKHIDHRRQESLRDVAPELAKALDFDVLAS